MAKIPLNAPVYDLERNVTTLAALADAGKIDFRISHNFIKRDGSTRTAYFADFKGTETGYEISRLAYLSRTGQLVDIRSALGKNRRGK